MNPFDLCFSVPDDYNQIEEKDEKKNFVNSLWADSANNPVMSSKLICVFQTENQQSKSEVKIYMVIICLVNFWSSQPLPHVGKILKDPLQIGRVL